MFLSEWREVPSALCLAGKKKNLVTARVSMLLKSRASLICFRACFLPGRAKGLSAPREFPASTAQQAQMINNFKNAKYQLLNTNEAIWFNKICRSTDSGIYA